MSLPEGRGPFVPVIRLSLEFQPDQDLVLMTIYPHDSEVEKRTYVLSPPQAHQLSRVLVVRVEEYLNYVP